MKTIVIIAGLAGALAFTSVAFAAGNSTPGIDRYNQIGQNPNPAAQCGSGADSGGFGYWGKDFNRGIQNTAQHPDRGAGTQHGFNNAKICGNPPDSAPPN